MNEEAVLIMAPAIAAIQTALDDAKVRPGTDHRCLALARTDFEKALMILGCALDGGSILNA